jgi:hypothetical protein
MVSLLQWVLYGTSMRWPTTLTPPPNTEWYMDTSADSHMTSNSSNLLSSQPPSSSHPTCIVVGNGSLLSITSTSHTLLSILDRPLHLHHDLVSLDIIKNLISICQFITNNQVSVEFDPFRLFVKDLHTRNMIVRCNSTGNLYPLCLPQQPSSHALHVGATPFTLWHHRLGYLGFEALSTLVPSYNKSELDTLCHACQLSRHTRHPFHASSSHAIKNFDLIHCDLWTSLILSISGYKYYLILLDDCSHYTWTFPLRLKSDTFQVMSHFFAHVRTQFGSTIKPSNVITVGSLTTLAHALFFSPMA